MMLEGSRLMQKWVGRCWGMPMGIYVQGVRAAVTFLQGYERVYTEEASGRSS